MLPRSRFFLCVLSVAMFGLFQRGGLLRAAEPSNDGKRSETPGPQTGKCAAPLRLWSQCVQGVVDEANPMPGERRAAAWVLNIGGAVRIWAAGDSNWIDVRKMENLPHVPFVIHRIFLNGNKKVTAAGLKNLAGLTDVYMLILDNSSLDRQGLLSLPPMPSLTFLDVDRTTIDSDAFARISQYPLLHKLEARQTNVDDDLAEYLANNKKLEIVRAGDTKVTEMGARRLRKLLPDCLIDFGPAKTAAAGGAKKD